jgi:hypothetical protein
MKKTKYIGVFNNGQHTYTLEVSCNGFNQAFILLTAKAIESGKHYQLETITDEIGVVFRVEPLYNITKHLLSRYATFS